MYTLAMKESKSIKKGKYGRKEGIRTLESLRFTRVPGVLLQPLGHLSMIREKIIAKNFIKSAKF